MEVSFIKIISSFNKSSDEKLGSPLNIHSTRNEQVPSQVIADSQAILSTTASLQNGSFVSRPAQEGLFLRDVLVGAIGSVIGAVITYLIFGIK